MIKRLISAIKWKLFMRKIIKEYRADLKTDIKRLSTSIAALTNAMNMVMNRLNPPIDDKTLATLYALDYVLCSLSRVILTTADATAVDHDAWTMLHDVSDALDTAERDYDIAVTRLALFDDVNA